MNSSLHYQIFEFDINIIQILVWIIGSTCREGESLKQIWHVNSKFFTVTRDTHGTRGCLWPEFRVRLKETSGRFVDFPI